MLSKFPWKDPVFANWRISSIYNLVGGSGKDLYVCLEHNDGHCIIERGTDDEYLWNRLWWKAYGYENKVEQPSQIDPKDQHL